MVRSMMWFESSSSIKVGLGAAVGCNFKERCAMAGIDEVGGIYRLGRTGHWGS